MSVLRFGSRVFRFSRAGVLDRNPAVLEQLAASEMAVVPDGSTFVVLRTDVGLEHLFVTDDVPSAAGVAFNLARTVAARSDEVDVAPDLVGARFVSRLVFRRDSVFSQSTQVGADFLTVSSVLGQSLLPGEWVAVSVRRRSKVEARRVRRWLDFRGVSTHHSLKQSAVVMSLWGGSLVRGRAGVNVARVAGALAGFGFEARPVSVSRLRVLLGGLFGWGVGAVLGVGVGWVLLVLGVPVWGAGLLGLVVGGGGAFVGGASWFPWRRFQSLLLFGRVPVAPERAWWRAPRAPRGEKVDREGRVSPAFEGDYPLDRSGFVVAPYMPLSLVAPHAGVESGVGSTRQRATPPVLRGPVGPLFGFNDGGDVFLSEADMWSGVALFGLPGSGKTAYLESLWGDICGRRVSEGLRHGLVAIDVKGDGKMSGELAGWSRSVGDRLVEFHVSDKSALEGIDMFPRVGSVDEQARRIVSALTYLFGETSIGARSFDTLHRVFQGALTVTPDVVGPLLGVAANRSPFYYADILLGNRGDELGQQLFGELRARVDVLPEGVLRPVDADDWVAGVEALDPVYGGSVTRSARQSLLDAPRTKVAALMQAEHWWSRPNKLTWRQILENHLAVVVNVGQAPNGDQPADEKLTTEMSSLLFYTLVEEMKRSCAGWQDAGRSTSVFVDEVKQVAAESPVQVTWLRNDGRSFGVRPVFATQYPQQLPADVRRTMMSFGTLVAFAQNDADAIGTLVADFGLDGAEWSAADLVGLGQFEAVVRATVDAKRQPAFTAVTHNFRERRDGRV